MNYFDIRTVLAGQAMITLACTATISLLWRYNHRQYRGLSLWLVDYVLQSAGALLLLTRGFASDDVSMVAANLFLMGGLPFLYAGLAAFAGRPSGYRLNAAAYAVFSAFHCYFSLFHPFLLARNLNINLFLVFFMLRCAWLASHSFPPGLRRISRPAAHPMYLFAAVCLLRMIFAVLESPVSDFLSQHSVDTVFLMSYAGLLVLITFGLSLMVNRRLQADMRVDLEGRLAAEAALRGATKVARLGTWELNAVTGGLTCSSDMYSIFGLEPAALKGEISGVIDRAVHPDDRAALRAAIASASSGGTPPGLEYRVLRSGGRLGWIYSEVSELVRDDKGAVSALRGYAQDITERKNNEEKLRDSASRLELALDSAGMGTWQWDIKADRRTLGVRCYTLMGLDAGSFRGTRGEFLASVHPDDRAPLEAELARALVTGEMHLAEYRVQLPGGRIRHLASRGRLRRDKNGEPLVMEGVLMDITERKAAEDEIRASEERLMKAFEAAPILMSLSDLEDGRCIAVNAMFSKLSGYSREEVIGRSGVELGWLSAGTRANLRRRFIDHLRIPEIEMTGKGGRKILCSYACQRIRIHGRDLLLAIAEDVTSVRKAEAALRSAQKLESLGTLAGGIAHDFNNLLTGIAGNISLLRAGKGGDRNAMLREADDACEAARSLARQLLTFASGGEPVKAPLDLAALAGECLSFSLRGSNVKGGLSGVTEQLAVMGDREQLFQTFSNLILNAAQAMDGVGSVEVRARRAALRDGEAPPLPRGDYALVEVRDRGRGIPADIMGRIFEPYFSTKGKGRGLGLAVCRSIVVRHGGQINAVSEPGKGSVFSVYLPLTSAALPAPAKEAPLPRQAGGRVLVLEDEKVVFMLLERMMTALGYQPEIVTDGVLAVEAWRSAMAEGRPFKAGVMDLTISGGMGGAEALKLIKDIDPSARLIASSGYSDDPIMADYSAHGFAAVLPKPYRLADVSRLFSGLG